MSGSTQFTQETAFNRPSTSRNITCDTDHETKPPVTTKKQSEDEGRLELHEDSSDDPGAMVNYPSSSDDEKWEDLGLVIDTNRLADGQLSQRFEEEDSGSSRKLSGGIELDQQTEDITKQIKENEENMAEDKGDRIISTQNKIVKVDI